MRLPNARLFRYGESKMLKKLSAVAASFVVFVFLAVSIAHACSGLSLVNLAVQQSFTNMDGANLPCHTEKSDLCKSVRDSILSLKPSMPAVENPEQSLLTIHFPIERPSLFGSSPITFITQGAFHPVFKLPFPLSYLVLRI